MNKISLNAFGNSTEDLISFRDALLEAMGDEAYYIDDVDDFLFYSLNCVEEFQDMVVLEKKSFEEYSLKILMHFGIPEKDGVKEKKVYGPQKKELPVQSEKFLGIILNLEALPAQFYLPAKRKVERELSSLVSLIKAYEENKEVKQTIENKGVPRNHFARTVWDFYQRCLKEQTEILNFLLDGIKSRSLYKAFAQAPGLNFAFLDQYLDHPYKYGLDNNESFFDYTKIEKVAHRLTDYPEALVKEMKELYNNNKEEYYKNLNIHYPPEKVFAEYDWYQGRIISTTDRKEIFEELKLLFTNKNWFGFYALALTQVEGLFTEMQMMIENRNKGSLPEKVEIVRQGHPYDSSLDYYEYHIPNLRNKFLHKGHDVEIKWKATDLFYDLSHVLMLFSSLDNPFQNLVNLVKAQRPEDFSSIEEVLRYFSLLDEVYKKTNVQDVDTAKLFQTLEYEVKQFEKNFLMRACSIDFLAENLIINLPKKILTLSDQCKTTFDKVGIAVDMQTMNYNELKTLLGIGGNREKIKEVFNLGDKFVEIVQAKLFLEGYKTWLPSLPQKLKDDLHNCYGTNKNMLSKIELFYTSI